MPQSVGAQPIDGQDGSQTYEHAVDCLQRKEPKKLGRPVTFKGDPESSQLSDGERKRIKRRIANRESARRVRQKRQVLMEELHCKAGSCRVSRSWQPVYFSCFSPELCVYPPVLFCNTTFEYIGCSDEGSPVQLVLHASWGATNT